MCKFRSFGLGIFNIHCWINRFINDCVITWERGNSNIKMENATADKDTVTRNHNLQLFVYLKLAQVNANSSWNFFFFHLILRMRERRRDQRNVKYFCICIKCGKMHVQIFSIEWFCVDDFPFATVYTEINQIVVSKEQIAVMFTVLQGHTRNFTTFRILIGCIFFHRCFIEFLLDACTVQTTSRKILYNFSEGYKVYVFEHLVLQ